MVAPPPRLSRDAALPRHDATVALPGTRPTNPGQPFCAKGWPVSGWYWEKRRRFEEIENSLFQLYIIGCEKQYIFFSLLTVFGWHGFCNVW